MWYGELCALIILRHAFYNGDTDCLFWGALQISELVAASKNDTALSSLQRKDVWVAEVQIVINLQRSKTCHLGKGQVVMLGKGSIAEICRIRVAIVYTRSIADEDGGFPRHKDSSLLTKYQF